MSLAYYICLNSSEPPFDSFVNGKAIGRELKRIEEIGGACGLQKFDEYTSVSKEEIESMMDEAGKAEPPEWWKGEEWFDPNVGLSWVSGLIKAVTARKSELESPDAVLEDLNEYKIVLKEAHKANLKWHLAIDY